MNSLLDTDSNHFVTRSFKTRDKRYLSLKRPATAPQAASSDVRVQVLLISYRIAAETDEVGLLFWLAAFSNVSLKVILPPGSITAAALILWWIAVYIRVMTPQILLDLEDALTAGDGARKGTI